MSRVSTALVLLTAACGHTGGQDCVCAPSPEQRNEALTPSTVVPRGTIRGVVIDSATGRPTPGASVFWEPSQAGAVSGANGEFTIVGIPAGPGLLRARLIGYKEWMTAGEMADDSGLAARIAVQQVMVPMNCDVFGPPLTGVAVTVRDAVEGGRPRGTIRVEVRDGAYSEKAEFTADAEAVAGYLELVRARPGIYTISVTGAHYRPWTAEGIELKVGSCGWTDGINVAVWLIPK